MVVIAEDSSNVPKLLVVDANGNLKVVQPLSGADDNDISSGSTTSVVICLNYVWDSVNSKWVRMTQP